MKRTGEILRKAREAKGLSINELAISLKINSKALTAIEDGDLSKLPAKTFLRGFVQSYAQALKVDVNEVLNIFSEEMGSTRPQPIVAPTTVASVPASTSAVIARPTVVTEAPASGPVKAPPSNENGLKGLEETNRLKTVLMVGVSLALIGMIFGAKKVIDRYQRESTKDVVVIANPLNHEGATETPVPAAPATTTETTSPTTATATATGTPPAPAPDATATPVVEKPAVPPPPPVAEKKLEPKAEAKKEETKPAAPKVAVNAPVDLPPSASAPSPLQMQPISATNALLFPSLATNSPLRSEVPHAEKIAKPLEPTTPKVVADAKPEVKPEPKAEAKAEPKAEAKPETKPETKDASAETAATPAPEEKKKPKKSLELIIEAMDAVDVEYAGQSGQAQKIHLDADQVHTIRSRNGLKLTVSNGGAVNLILNGRDLGVPGGLGSPVTLTY